MRIRLIIVMTMIAGAALSSIAQMLTLRPEATFTFTECAIPRGESVMVYREPSLKADRLIITYSEDIDWQVLEWCAPSRHLKTPDEALIPDCIYRLSMASPIVGKKDGWTQVYLEEGPVSGPDKGWVRNSDIRIVPIQPLSPQLMKKYMIREMTVDGHQVVVEFNCSESTGLQIIFGHREGNVLVMDSYFPGEWRYSDKPGMHMKKDEYGCITVCFGNEYSAGGNNLVGGLTTKDMRTLLSRSQPLNRRIYVFQYDNKISRVICGQ